MGGVRGTNDVDGLAAALDAELDGARRRREQRVITASTDIDSRVEVGATLANDDLAGLHDLATESLDAQPLRIGITTIA